MKFGSPHGLMMFLEASLFNIFLAMIDRIGTIQLAATNLVFSLNTLAFIPMIGLQTSVMILVGQRIGEGRPEVAARTTRTAVILCSIYMAVWAVLYLGFPHTVVGLFGNEDAASRATRDISVILLRFVAAYTIFDGLQIIYGGAIRGAGDTRFSLFLYIISEILVMVVPTWIGIRYFGLGLLWAWTCMTGWVVVLAIGFFLRFQQGRWRSMRVIEHSVVDPESLAEFDLPATEPPAEVKV
jgi:MATE family multidrug resistance protein